VGAYGVYVSPSIVSPFFTSIDGGTAWTTYGELDHNDKSLAWSQDGSTLFAATLVDTSGNNAEINTYSGTISGSDFGSPINTFNPVRDLDQPWIRTGSGADVYVVRSDSGGADGFDALGSGGLGVNVASPTGWFADTSDGSLTLGKNRTGAGSELAIAVDPNNAGHVVIAYGTAPGASIDSGE